MSRKDIIKSCVYVCDFCGKDEKEVAQIISGQLVRGDRVCICNECVVLCQEVIDDAISSGKEADCPTTEHNEAA